MKILFILAFLISFAVILVPLRAQEQLRYEVHPQMLWEEKEVEALGDHITNYTLKENKNIVMNFSFFDQDLSKEIKEKSVDEVVKQLICYQQHYNTTFF